MTDQSTQGQTNQGQTAGSTIMSGYTSGVAGAAQQPAGQQTAARGGAGVGGQAVIGVFDSRSQAEQAINQLRQQGFTNEEISVVTKKGKEQEQPRGGQYVSDDITDGALTGGTIGGLGGLILGAGALAIPGIGPIVAAGPIAAAMGGAVAGGVAGGLIDWGIPAEVSRRYEQRVAAGGILAVVHTTAAKVNQAAQILRQGGATDVEAHPAKQSGTK